MAAVLTVCPVTAAGCGDRSAAGHRPDDARAVDGIERAIATLPHVTRVTADYRGMGVQVSVLVEPHGYRQLDPVVDHVERTVWEAPLTRLLYMQVVVQDETYAQERRAYVLAHDPTWRRLEQRYGPRGAP
jgi:hypothetical protein